ncbi:inhibitor of growth protein 5 isoform X6 [Kogia breviceps]|uniref:inhibitor of growth protein 5 isoform X6 n=1 Tax=Kogia breviceps TaxID=27615 RepID=UPI0034D28F85
MRVGLHGWLVKGAHHVPGSGVGGSTAARGLALACPRDGLGQQEGPSWARAPVTSRPLPSTLPPQRPLQVRLEGRWCGVPGLLAGWGCPHWGVLTSPAASPTAMHPASALEPGVTGADCAAAGTVQRGRASSRTHGADEARSVPESRSTAGEARVRWSEFTDTILSVHPSDVLDMPVDPNEPTYCLCHQVSYGEMIGCDNPDCPIEWFHFACVDLTTKPKGKWFCPRCVQERRKKK